MSTSIQYSQELKHLKEELIGLNKQKAALTSDLKKIQSSRAYWLWQSLNEVKPRRSTKQRSMPPIMVKQNKISSKKSQPKKKIALLTDRLLTGFGVDLVVHEQAQLLSEKYEVTVYAIAIDPDFIRNANYNVCQVFIPQYFNPIKQDCSSIKYFLEYRNLFLNFDTFIIHTPTFHSWIPFLKKYAKTIVYYHGNSPSSNYSGLKRLRQPLLNTLENYLYFPHADKLAVISSYLTTKLASFNQKKSTVVQLAGNHTSDTLNNISANKKKLIFHSYGFSDRESYVLYIGRLDYHNNPYKNTRLLMDIAKEIGAPEKYKVLGIGFPENNIQEELHNANVYSIANASAEELATFLEQAYIYVSPSLWEGFNLPLLEAQTLGVPVVAFDLPAHREIVINEKTGFLVQDEAELISKIKYLIANKVLRDEMGRAAQEHARNFTWKKNVEEFSKIL